MTRQESKAYHSGWTAFRKGKTLTDNPHHCATEANAKKLRAWKRGFEDARQGKGHPELDAALNTILAPGFGAQ